MVDFKVTDKSGDKKYFTMIPNYIINHSTVYEQAIYLYMKRVAGENGTCWMSPAKIAKSLGCSRNTVEKYQKELIKRGWIKEVGEKGYTKPTKEYEIVDLWDLNMEYYSQKDTKKESSTGEQSPNKTKESSTSEKKVQEMNIESSTVGNKEDIYKKNNNNISNGKKISVTGKEITLNKDGKLPALVETKDGVILHNSEFTDLIKMFEPVNPSTSRLYMNKGQTDALKRLLKEHGYEKIKMVIGKLPEIVNKPYAPVITTPYQLEQKLGQLFAYIKRESGKGGAVDARHVK